MPVIPALRGRGRDHRFKASVGYIAQTEKQKLKKFQQRSSEVSLPQFGVLRSFDL